MPKVLKYIILHYSYKYFNNNQYSDKSNYQTDAQQNNLVSRKCDRCFMT
jgi:hypothetical protein